MCLSHLRGLSGNRGLRHILGGEYKMNDSNKIERYLSRLLFVYNPAVFVLVFKQLNCLVGEFDGSSRERNLRVYFKKKVPGCGRGRSHQPG